MVHGVRKPEDQRNALWNVLSLEFSGTELAETVSLLENKLRM